MTKPPPDLWLGAIGVLGPFVLFAALRALNEMKPWAALDHILLFAFVPVFAAMVVAWAKAVGATYRWSSAALFCAWMFALSAGLIWLSFALAASC